METLVHVQHMASAAGHVTFEVTAFLLSVSMFIRVLSKDARETKAAIHYHRIAVTRMQSKGGKHVA